MWRAGAGGVCDPPARGQQQAGWIAPVVVVGGLVHGTWERKSDRIAVARFKEGGKPPKPALDAEVARLSATLGRKLTAALSLT